MGQIEERVPPKMTLKSSPLVWSLAFMAAFLALTKETATKETEVHPYSILIHHPSDPDVQQQTIGYIIRALAERRAKKGNKFYTTRFGKKKRAQSHSTVPLSRTIDGLIKDVAGLQRPIQEEWDWPNRRIQRDVLCTKDEQNCFPIVKNYAK